MHNHADQHILSYRFLSLFQLFKYITTTMIRDTFRFLRVFVNENFKLYAINN